MFIGAISGIVAAVNTPNNLCTVYISLSGALIDSKFDTGTKVTAFPSTTFNSLADVKLRETDRILKGPGQEDLQVRGKFMTALRWQQKCRQEVSVIEKLQKPLISRTAIEHLGLLVRIGEVLKSCLQRYQQALPTVCTGLGKTQQEYQIRLSADATSFSITAP